MLYQPTHCTEKERVKIAAPKELKINIGAGETNVFKV